MTLATKTNPRAQAVLAIYQVVYHNKSLADIFPDITLVLEAKELALTQEIIYGTLRFWWTLSALADSLLAKKPKNKDGDIYCLIIMGLYQIQYMRIPDHAAVNETVKLVKKFKKPWAKQLVNAILRNYLRDKETLKTALTGDLCYDYSHPMWFILQVQKDWPLHWQDILKANNIKPSLYLRVNTEKINRDEALLKLNELGINAVKSKSSKVGLKINTLVGVLNTSLWNQGMLSVQDESAQIACNIVPIKPKMRVLDACAAPGGKTGHLLEIQAEQELLAVDISESRMQRLNENLHRLGLKCTTKVAKIQLLESWWDKMPYDLIILDAPCTGSGVVGKHPDIKHLKNKADLNQLVEQQRQMLEVLWGTLKPDGHLVYLTCSIFHQENKLQIQHFLKINKNARLVELEKRFGINVEPGRQRLPGLSDANGFYYANIKKIDA